VINDYWNNSFAESVYNIFLFHLWIQIYILLCSVFINYYCVVFVVCCCCCCCCRVFLLVGLVFCLKVIEQRLSLLNYIIMNSGFVSNEQIRNCQSWSFIAVRGQCQSNGLGLYCQVTIWSRKHKRKTPSQDRKNLPRWAEFEILRNGACCHLMDRNQNSCYVKSL